MVIRIPIEIQTSESTEIRQLLDRIDAAESKLSQIRNQPQPSTAGERAAAKTLLGDEPTGGGQQIPTTGITPINRQQRAAVGPSEVSRTSPIGTPLGGPEDQERLLPRSRTAGGQQGGEGAAGDLVRQNQFRALQEKTFNLEEKINQGIGLGGQAIGTATLFAGAKGTQALTGLFKTIAPIAGPIGVAFLIQSVSEQIINELIRPGGILDRRFKRDFEREANAFRTRQDKGLIRAGIKEIRVSSGGRARRATKDTVSTTLNTSKVGFFADDDRDLSFSARGF